MATSIRTGIHLPAVEHAGDGPHGDVPLLRAQLAQKFRHGREQHRPALRRLNGIHVRRGGVRDVAHCAVYGARGGVAHLAANDVLHKIAPRGQPCVRTGKIGRFADISAGGIHIVHPAQLYDAHALVRAHALNFQRRAALRRRIQPRKLRDKFRAVGPWVQLQFAHHAVRGDELPRFQICFHDHTAPCCFFWMA